MILKNRFCHIQNRFCDIKKDLRDLVISNNSIFWHHKIVSVISKYRFCDITKYVEFSIDEIMTPMQNKNAGVFPGRRCEDATSLRLIGELRR